MPVDALKKFSDKVICPVCGCIDVKGSFRCLGCGTFHSGAHLTEREAPEPDQQLEPNPVDPSAYSIGPDSKIMEESFEQSEEVTQWSGGSTDFSMGQDDYEVEESRKEDKFKIPDSEEL